MEDLIIRFLGGHASPFETERLRRWREESEENEELFQELARVWELTAPEPQAEGFPVPRAEDLLGARATPTRRSRRFPPGSPMVWGLLAASLAAVALGVSAVLGPSPSVLATYQAPQDQTLTVTLADGSFVRLAPGSTLQEMEAQGKRAVTLSGRGFFAVARDEGRPFVVRAGMGEISVLGTRFQVREGEGGEVRTAVVEGRVAVAGPEGRVEIGAGELAVLSEGAPPTVSQPEDIYALLDWPEGILVFQGTPLHKVSEDVSRHFGRPLEVTGEGLRNRRVTAWFGSEGFDEVAESLCMVTEAHCLGSQDGVIMAPQAGEGGGS